LNNPSYVTAVQARYRAMRDKGCQFIASTDARIPRVYHQDLPKALAVFRQIADFSPVQTLRSATSDCAKALAIDHVTGRLETGLSADLLIFDQSPLADLSILENPEFVFAQGRLIKGE